LRGGADFAGRFLAVRGAEQQIHRRHHEQREQRADRDPRGDHQTHVEAADRAGAARRDQRQHAQHHRRRRHQDRTQADAGGVLDRLALGQALQLQLVGELDDQNAVLADEPDQRHQAHFGIDVQARASDP